jgi:tRNA guanosine-2'-O-methyltransferase
LCVKKLETAPQLDLEALRVCIKLRPSPAHDNGEGQTGRIFSPDLHAPPTDGQTAEGHALAEQLCDLVVSRISNEDLDSDHFYKMASILCSDGTFAAPFFEKSIYPALRALLPRLSIQAHKDAESSDDAEASLREAINSATAYLALLKASYWLPSHHNHVVGPESLQCISQFLAVPTVDSIAHDTVAAFFSLLKRRDPIVVATMSNATPSWLKLDQVSGQMVLSAPIINGSLWDQLSVIDVNAHASGESNMSERRVFYSVRATTVLAAVS